MIRWATQKQDGEAAKYQHVLIGPEGEGSPVRGDSCRDSGDCGKGFQAREMAKPVRELPGKFAT